MITDMVMFEITWNGHPVIIEVNSWLMVVKAINKNGFYQGGLTGRKFDDVLRDERCTHSRQIG